MKTGLPVSLVHVDLDRHSRLMIPVMTDCAKGVSKTNNHVIIECALQRKTLMVLLGLPGV